MTVYLTYGEWLHCVIDLLKRENLKARRARPVTAAMRARRERDRRYNTTEAGRARGARYDQSPHGRAIRAAYEASLAGIMSRMQRRARESVSYHQARVAALGI